MYMDIEKDIISNAAWKIRLRSLGSSLVLRPPELGPASTDNNDNLTENRTNNAKRARPEQQLIVRNEKVTNNRGNPGPDDVSTTVPASSSSTPSGKPFKQQGIVAVRPEELREKAERQLREEVGEGDARTDAISWKMQKVCLAHEGRVNCVCTESVSNEWFVTGGADSNIIAWDLATGKKKLTLVGHKQSVNAISVSTRSPYLFSCGDDKSVKCWDLETNKIVRDYFGHLSAVCSIATHSSQDIIVTGGRDATVRVWDIRTRTNVHIMSGHEDTVLSLAVQGTEPQIISGGSDAFVFFWDIGSGRPITRLTRHKKAVRAVVPHPLEQTLVTVGADALRKWRLPVGEYMHALTAPASTPPGLWHCAALSPFDLLAVGGADGFLRFYDWHTGLLLQATKTKDMRGTLAGEGGILGCTFDKSGQRLITVEGDKSVKLWGEVKQQ